MSETKRVALLIGIMIGVVVVAVVCGVSLVYNTSFEQQRDRLAETAQSQARLIEAIYANEAVTSKDAPGGPEAAVSRVEKRRGGV